MKAALVHEGAAAGDKPDLPTKADLLRIIRQAVADSSSVNNYVLVVPHVDPVSGLFGAYRLIQNGTFSSNKGATHPGQVGGWEGWQMGHEPCMHARQPLTGRPTSLDAAAGVSGHQAGGGPGVGGPRRRAVLDGSGECGHVHLCVGWQRPPPAPCAPACCRHAAAVLPLPPGNHPRLLAGALPACPLSTCADQGYLPPGANAQMEILRTGGLGSFGGGGGEGHVLSRMAPEELAADIHAACRPACLPAFLPHLPALSRRPFCRGQRGVDQRRQPHA